MSRESYLNGSAILSAPLLKKAKVPKMAASPTSFAPAAAPASSSEPEAAAVSAAETHAEETALPAVPEPLPPEGDDFGEAPSGVDEANALMDEAVANAADSPDDSGGGGGSSGGGDAGIAPASADDAALQQATADANAAADAADAESAVFLSDAARQSMIIKSVTPSGGGDKQMSFAKDSPGGPILGDVIGHVLIGGHPKADAADKAGQRAIELGNKAVKAGNKAAGQKAVAAGQRAIAASGRLNAAAKKAAASAAVAKAKSVASVPRTEAPQSVQKVVDSVVKPVERTSVVQQRAPEPHAVEQVVQQRAPEPHAVEQVVQQRAPEQAAKAPVVQQRAPAPRAVEQVVKSVPVVQQQAAPLAGKTPTLLLRGDDVLPFVLKSPLDGVSDEAWTRFALAVRSAPVGAVGLSNELGMFALKPRRLEDLGLVMNLGMQRAKNGRMAWRGEFVPPMTSKKFLSDPAAQYAAFADSMHRYVVEMRAGKIPTPEGGRPKEMTLSGALAVLHRCGPSGIKTWNDEAKRFPDTNALYEKTNGIF